MYNNYCMCACQAWDDTFMNWETSTRYLDNYPKTRLEEGGVIADTFHGRWPSKRRPSHSTEHELEVCLRFLSFNFYTLNSSLCAQSSHAFFT